LRGGALVMGSTLVWHLSNFAFNSVSARILGPTSYGTLAVVVALLYVASPLFFSIQTVTSRMTTRLAARGELGELARLIPCYGRRLALAGLLIAVVVALSSSGLASFLRVSSAAPIAILGLALLFAAITHFQRGVLQGTMRFERYALSTICEAIAKIGACLVLLLLLWRSVDAAVLAIAVGTLVGMLVNYVLLRFLPASRRHLQPIAHPFRYSLVTLSCLLLLAALLSVDLLAAKRYLDPHAAGLYAAISLSGKIVFFATSALAVYLFPVFSERQERGLDSKRPLSVALCCLAGGSALLLGVYFLAPQMVVMPLFGAHYAAAGTYVGWMAAAFSAYAVVYLMATYLLSQQSSLVTPVLAIGAFVQLGGLYAFHSSITDIITVQFVVMLSLALAMTTLAMQARAVSAAPEPA
jgi:O-antigen/teichoic acid export membrane protein